MQTKQKQKKIQFFFIYFIRQYCMLHKKMRFTKLKLRRTLIARAWNEKVLQTFLNLMTRRMQKMLLFVF